MGIFRRIFGHRAELASVVIPTTRHVPESGPAVGKVRRKAVDGRDQATLPANAVLLGGHGRVQVHGESFHQGELNAICGGKCPEGHRRKVLAILLPEPENPYDSNAVGVQVDGRMVGHIGRQGAAEYQPIAKLLTEKGKLGAARAFIAGGWIRPGGDEGHYGITLELSPTAELMKTRKITNL
jgi:hypothetical protein